MLLTQEVKSVTTTKEKVDGWGWFSFPKGKSIHDHESSHDPFVLRLNTHLKTAQDSIIPQS